jgi:hypothetical protein
MIDDAMKRGMSARCLASWYPRHSRLERAALNLELLNVEVLHSKTYSRKASLWEE